MYEESLKQLEYISKEVGFPVDYTQGGGGNTSVKLDDERMAVKASGYKLKQITTREGYVVVNHKNIKAYYESVDLGLDRDYEKESAEFVRKNVIEMEGLKTLRPSVEAGFHSVLKKFVIHTHPVYANILCCSANGRELVSHIFKDKEYAAIWIPYINPGFCLTLKIMDGIKECMAQKGMFPEVIFMENHGLIVTSDDARHCVKLHDEVNSLIRSYLGIKVDYPSIQLEKVDDNTFTSRTDAIVQYFKNSHVSDDFFDRTVLYPDQLVYLNGSISINGMDKKLNINNVTGEVTYKTGEPEAQTIEETLLAYLYVISNIKAKGLSLKTMTAKEIDFIKNWESEAYRKSLVKELK